MLIVTRGDPSLFFITLNRRADISLPLNSLRQAQGTARRSLSLSKGIQCSRELSALFKGIQYPTAKKRSPFMFNDRNCCWFQMNS